VSETFDAFRIPGLAGDAPIEESLVVGGLSCRYPRPAPELMEATTRHLRTAGRALRERPVQEVLRAIDGAAARLADPADPLRVRADQLLPLATGYSPEMATLVLDHMIADWRADSLGELLVAEFRDPGVLDRFVPTGAGRRSRAYGASLAFHVFAGNVPGVSVTSLVRSLLVRTPVLGKLASGQPVLPVLFAEALDSVDPELGEALAVTYWPGGDPDAEGPVLDAADLVVVYGGEDAVASFRGRIQPHQRLVLHGPRLSIALVGADAPDGDLAFLARQLARAVATFDQQGCVSPHAVWIEDPDGGAAAAFAEALAGALREVEAALPRGRISPGEASAIQQERGAAEMRGHASGNVRVLRDEGTRWTVVLDAEGAFRPSCLNRFVYVHPVADLDQAIDLMAPAGRQLQSVALAVAESRRVTLGDRLARIGATRITTFQRLPWPPVAWHHDGNGPLRELVRWVDLES
jgi:hypothetical protein